MKRKWLLKYYYDTTIIILALISVVLVLLGFAEMIDLDSPPYSIIDLLIWFVFVVDYGWRFFSSKAKWRFILENIFDLLAILPLNAIFTVFRLGSVSIRLYLSLSKTDKITETDSSFKDRRVNWKAGKEGKQTLTDKWLTLYFLSQFLYCTGREFNFICC